MVEISVERPVCIIEIFFVVFLDLSSQMLGHSLNWLCFLPFKTFPIHYSLVVPPCNAVQPELLTAMLS
jgi:hypothetical protein